MENIKREKKKSAASSVNMALSSLRSTTAFLLVFLALSSLESSDAAACASGSDDTGKLCPPDDTKGPCPSGCELTTSSTSEAAITCTTYPMSTGIGVEKPCGSDNSIYATPQTLAQPTTLT